MDFGSAPESVFELVKNRGCSILTIFCDEGLKRMEKRFYKLGLVSYATSYFYSFVWTTSLASPQLAIVAVLSGLVCRFGAQKLHGLQ